MNAFCVLEVNFLKWEESIISFKWNKLEKRKSSNRLEREIYLAKTWLHRFLNNILIFDPLCTFTNFRNPKPSFLGVLQNYCLLWYQIHILGILGRYLDQVEIFVNFQFKYVCILHETLQSVFPIRSCIKFFSNSKPSCKKEPLWLVHGFNDTYFFAFQEWILNSNVSLFSGNHLTLKSEYWH